VEAEFHTGFSGFAASIDGPAGPLSTTFPVEWLSFEGSVAGRDVLLNWSTASEQNNDYFEIRRSPDGQTFIPVGEVTGKGNSNEPVPYEFYDFEAANMGQARWYYQLRQVDLDGQSSLSSVIEVNIPQGQIPFRLVSPPTAGTPAQVQIPGGEESLLGWRIIDMQGKNCALNGNWVGTHLHLYGWETLAEGIYILQIQQKQGMSSLKIRWQN